MDLLALDAVNRFEPELLYRRLISSDVEMCGGYGTVLAMMTLKKMGVGFAVEVGYYNSGDIVDTPESRASVVGYGASIFVKKSRHRQLHSENWFTEEEQQELLRLARDTIAEYLRKDYYTEHVPRSDRLYKPFGAFVTLTSKKGELRGCIGYIENDKPVYKVVQEMAVAAATKDPRFPPVKPEELENLVIEISVLSPLNKIKKTSDIEVGRHGILVRKGYASGLLLPQVAVEWSFDAEEFLKQAIFKAGLDPGSIKAEELEVYTFTAQVFSEKDFEN